MCVFLLKIDWMKLKLFFLLLAPQLLFAQVSKPDAPRYLKQNQLAVNQIIEIPRPDLEDVRQMQLSAKKMHRNMPFGKVFPVELSSKQSTSQNINESLRSDVLEVSCEGAKGLTVYLSDVFLPIGSKLYVTSHTSNEIYGPFTEADVLNERLVPSMIKGDHIKIVSVYSRNSRIKPSYVVTELGYNTGDLSKPQEDYGSRDFGDSENCQINVNCSEGDNWRKQQNAVVRVQTRAGNYLGWCTGTLMNNTLQDCTPYVLTADHCRELEGEAATEENYNDWQFYFNYEGTDCKNPRERDVSIGSYTGCKRISYSKRMGGGGPDALLVKLSNTIEEFYNPHFAGWENFDEISSNGVMIHHPSGDIKKISTYNTAIIESEWDKNIRENTHWEVYWSSTDNGRGVSEPGSSGSALFNSRGRVIGVLTGGASACKEDQDKGVSPDYPDYFGKISLAWRWLYDPESSLFPHLDGSNHTPVLDGIDWPCSELALTNDAVSNLLERQISLYPNPAKRLINLDMGGLQLKDLKAYDLAGSELLVMKTEVDKKIVIDINSWQTGIYMVQIVTTGNNIINKKLIVE